MAPAPNSAPYSRSDWTWEEKTRGKKPAESPLRTWFGCGICVYSTPGTARTGKDSTSGAAPCCANQLSLAHRNSRTTEREVRAEIYQKSDSIDSSKSSRDSVRGTGLAATYGGTELTEECTYNSRQPSQLKMRCRNSVPKKKAAAAASVRVKTKIKTFFVCNFYPQRAHFL